MKGYARDVVPVGTKTLEGKPYRICTMSIYVKATPIIAKAECKDDYGNLSFRNITDDKGKVYTLFNDTIIAQGSVFINITSGANTIGYFFSDEDAGTSEEWQSIGGN